MALAVVRGRVLYQASLYWQVELGFFSLFV